ncbi:sterol 3-beta-glucosyltransferase [Aspergillus udagawae]|uniref:Sterol 3-beta-glucosyltransferase n=1 Tax=Aspergillus udagawae TaxID=91492 RepID=A0ABQ1BEY4_9EURO|nr:sterol 3-beta-glucosyltransferase [Aspergillus udagawae]GFG00413.1 sterol 3-beta-glucosyltransferase [Aspergillus udagawae]
MAATQPTADALADNLAVPARVKLWKKSLDSVATLSGYGRLDLNLTEQNLARLFARVQTTDYPSTGGEPRGRLQSPAPAPKEEGVAPLHLNIVIHVIGSRGDIQPFLVIGKSLTAYGHRVRLATHLAFRDMVEESGLEFFNIGGNPQELMMFMVKNAGLLPGFETIRSGAIQQHRRDMGDIISGCWRSCVETGDGTQGHEAPSDSATDGADHLTAPFVADAIVANPPSLAHIHCAEKLGIPLTIMFTMPWSPTQAFPHPLASIRRYSTKPTVANFISYAVVDLLIWQGLGDIINRFRRKTLGLDILDTPQALTLAHRLHVPHAYLWSPALLPKPRDWSSDIDVCGFTFLSSASNYTPPEDLLAFLRAGSPPVYVGFGSIVVEDPQKLSLIVFEAIQKTGQRAIISKGWGGLGASEVDVPENIFLLDSCPHDWLFRHVSCVVHHGGAGTTAAGLKLGCPTVIVPFFGDQPFWGSIVARRGVGPSPIPYRELTADRLADAILVALEPSSRQKAHEISEVIQQESGTNAAVSSFHDHLQDARIRCALCPSRAAVWWLKDSEVPLSAFAMTVLAEAGLMKVRHVELYRSEEYDTARDPGTPLSALAQVVLGSIAKFMTDVGDISLEILAVISGQRCRKHSGRRSSNIEAEAIAWEISASSGDPSATLAHTPSRVTAAYDPGKKRSDRRVRMREEKQYPSKFTQWVPRAATRTERLAQEVLDFIVIPPMEISLTLSRGFHNVPLVFHDNTVRDIPRVTGMRSGLKAAGKELIFGVYDGVSGLVTLPRRGLKDSGAKGFIHGVGNGVGGFLSKPVAGLFGIAAYPLAGLHKHLKRSLAKGKQGHIKCARIAQGVSEYQCSSLEEREDVIRRWRALIHSRRDGNTF